MKIGNLKTGVRLGLGFSIVLTLTIAVNVTAILEMQYLADNIIKIYQHPLTVSNAVRDIRADIITMNSAVKDIISTKETEKIAMIAATIGKYEQIILQSFDLVSERFLGDKKDVHAARQAFVDWITVLDEAIRLMEFGETKKATAIIKKQGTINNMEQKIQVMINFASKKADSFFMNAQKYSQKKIFVMIFLLAITFLISMLVALVITWSIISPLGEMLKKVREIANGKLDNEIEIYRKDEIGELAHSMNDMVKSLSDMAKKAKLIAIGDYYSANIIPRSSKDKLGYSLQKMTITLGNISKFAESVALGDYSTKIEVKGEQDRLAKSLNSMVDTLANVVKQANQIADDNYSDNIIPRSDKDQLGISLQKMTTTLRNISQDNQRQNWIKSGQNKLNEVMSGDLETIVLVRNIISFLAKYIQAQVGVFYLYEEDSKELKLTASYAFQHRKHINSSIKIGEGLVGQAAFEREIISVTEVPDNYTRINSAIGDALPRNIVLIPLTYKDELTGVIELGTFQQLPDQAYELLTGIMDNIAISIASAQARTKMNDLLQTSQEQAEELITQQEELQQTNEELEERTKALEDNESILKKQQVELEISNEALLANEDKLRRRKNELQTANLALEQTRKEIEQKASELEISSRYKSEFLANMSHELRTPLNSMLILSQNLADNEESNLTATQIESAKIINNGGQDLLNLINEILDLSKIEAGKMTLDIQEVQLADMASILATTFKLIADKKQIELKVNLEQNLPAFILTDVQRLSQILKNLLSNALKFTEQGNVTINFQSASVSQIAISVTDTGIGIPKAKQHEIFEAFQQVDGSISRRYGGTGLGLSISKELAKLLGGEIKLTSIEGQGSNFTLYLPTYKVNPELKEISTLCSNNEQPISHIDDDRNNITVKDRIILIIEDDLYFAKILCQFAHKKGFKCLHAADGQTGIKFAEQYKPDAITLDLMLPKTDGWFVLNQLKENLNLRHIPVHIMSAQNNSSEFISKGAIGFLTKPVTEKQLDEVFTKIETVLDKKIKQILIVGSNTNIQINLQEILTSDDIKITTGDTDDKVISLLKSNDYDCMILGLSSKADFNILKKLKERAIPVPEIIIYTGRELSSQECMELKNCVGKVVLKEVKSDERMLDETSLFLHQIIKNLPGQKQAIISKLHDKKSLLSGKKILLVDDDTRNVFALANILQKKGLEVYQAVNGKDALIKLDKEPGIDLVVMDIMMPIMDGYEAMHAIRNQERFKKLPILALTAKAMKEDREKSLKAGANDYLTKPVDIEQMLSLMQVWLYK